ncbi:right-handed parallel beta-helix repeat-containing protein [Luteococcus sp. H138]|uniref:right-handed parallel beta-helix repeat-containing protein n=1 Tax=Luteococcus sp. H138 TaxID=3139404 RepID=UPI00313C26D0
MRVTAGTSPSDNAVRIERAMRQVSQRGGGTVVLPDSRVLVKPSQRTNRIDVPAGVHIVGSGKRSELALVPNVPWTELFHFSKGNGSVSRLKLTRTDVAYGRMLTFENGHGYRLDRLVIDTGYSRWPTNDFSAIQLDPDDRHDKVSGLSITNSTIQNTQYGLMEPSDAKGTVSGVTVDRSVFQNNHSDDLEFNAPSGVGRDVVVKNSTFRNNTAPGPGAGFAVGVANYQNVQILNNSFSNHPMNTVHLEDRTARVTIKGNSFVKASTVDTGFASAIVVLSGTHDVTITNNRINLTRQRNVAVPVVIGPGGAKARNPWNIRMTNNYALVKHTAAFHTDYGSANTVAQRNLRRVG